MSVGFSEKAILKMLPSISMITFDEWIDFQGNSTAKVTLLQICSLKRLH